MNLYFRKPWKIRDSNDKDYIKLGDTPDFRRQRADNIENQIIQNWYWMITTLIVIAFGLLNIIY